MTETPGTLATREAAVTDSGDLVAIARQTRQIKELGETLIASGLLPDGVKRPEAAVAIMLKGRELGVGPMYALSHIAIIKGRPTLSANLMAALVKRAGHKLRVIESTGTSCTVEGVRADDPDHKERLTFDESDARRANLWGQNTWSNYPRAMLKARAITALCGSMFADVLSGVIYTPEEMGAVVDEEGRVVEHPETREPVQASAVGEAEVVEDPEPDLATREQVETLYVLADQLFDDKDATLSGPQWLQEQLGKPFGELTASRAAALIAKYEERLNGSEGDDGGE